MLAVVWICCATPAIADEPLCKNESVDVLSLMTLEELDMAYCTAGVWVDLYCQKGLTFPAKHCSLCSDVVKRIRLVTRDKYKAEPPHLRKERAESAIRSEGSSPSRKKKQARSLGCTATGSRCTPLP